MFDNSGKRIKEQMTGIEDLYAGMTMPYLDDIDFRPESADYSLIQENPMMLLAQMEALGQTQQLANDGLSAQDKLAMEMANSQARQRARQSSEAAMQNASARGVSGSGLEFAMREMGNQSAAEGARMQGMEQAAASAKQRAMNQMAYTQGLGNLRSQDTQVKSANAGVINNFNQMNTQNRNQANLRNIDQRRANDQARFDNRMTHAGGMGGAKRGVADAEAAIGAQDAENAKVFTNMMGMGMMASDERLKEDVRNADVAVREVFDNLSPYLWKYINPEHGEGEFVGVMAQDLEKSSAGKNAVIETKEGKMVDFQKIIPMMMAAISSQQKRINELEASLG